MLQMKKGWFIAAYIFGVLFFVFYCYTNKDAMLDSMAYNLPAGANSQMFVLANVLSLIAAFAYAEGENRKKILRSLALYAFVTAEMWTICPENMGLVGGYAMFLLTGLYHVRLTDEKKLFSSLRLKDEDEKGDISEKKAKYYLWGLISVVMFLLEYWHV